MRHVVATHTFAHLRVLQSILSPQAAATRSAAVGVSENCQRRDKTFLIAEPMGKVFWTKRCVAGGRGRPVEVGEGSQKDRVVEAVKWR